MARSETYGSAFADVYDEWYATSDDLSLVVALLSNLAPRSVLELGVGTGRVAIPLAKQLAAHTLGSVTGIDESPEMLAHLRRKDRRGLVRTIVGDMVDDQPDEQYDMVFMSYNTLFNVDNEKRQARCVANAATRLSHQGVLVIDACVIDPNAPLVGSAHEQRGDWATTTTTRFDPTSGVVSGMIESKHLDGRVVERPFRIRYSSPTEIDRMASASGLHLESRHSGWDAASFSEDSSRHISVYRRIR